jgi:uncharacterized membrane protein YcaP (DUF421 family)
MGGILAAVTLLVLNYTLDRLGLKATWLRSQLVGQPSLLVHQGELIRAHLRAEGITEDEVMQALREHGVDDLHDVKDAILEVDGTISVVPAGAPSSRTRRRIRGRKPVG